MTDGVEETCPRCRGWVWHRSVPCECKPAVLAGCEGDFLPALGKRLRACRESQGLSLDALARRCGLSKTGLWGIEKGRSEPMARTVVVLSRALGVTTDYLLLQAEDAKVG